MPKLIEFMNDVQRDSRLNEILFPSYGEKRCMEIITRYSYHRSKSISSEGRKKRGGDVCPGPPVNWCSFKIDAECSYFWYRYEKNEELVKKKQLGKDALLNYMMSDENAPVILDRLDIYQVVLHIKSTYYLSHKTTALKSGFPFFRTWTNLWITTTSTLATTRTWSESSSEGSLRLKSIARCVH